MTKSKLLPVATALAAVLSQAATAQGAEVHEVPQTELTALSRAAHARGLNHRLPPVPATESILIAAPVRSTTSATTISPDSTLSGPVTLTYTGGSPALTVTDSGTNKGIFSQITNNRNASSALFGQTTGSGAGLSGYNYGTSGPAGKFYIVNGASDQASLYATTSGGGSAVLAVIDNNSSEAPAVYGQNNDSDEGIGVEGDGRVGVYGYTDYGTAVSGYAASGTAILGQSSGTNAIVGEAYGSGIGVYGYSESGYAGYFSGPVWITGSLYVSGVNISSDRNLKTGFAPVEGKTVLERIDAMPITTWNYRNDLSRRHLGPMAQDFHAAFGLDGDDDTHISLVDAAGVSLAAVKELNHQLKLEDGKIAALEARLDASLDAQAKLVKALAASLHQQGNAQQTAALAAMTGP